MARIRTIKPDFWTHHKVLTCKPLTRLLFIGMWNFADDYGRMIYAPPTLKAQVYPGDDISTADVKDMLNELNSIGLILIYSIDGREYIEITGWDHQKIDRRRESKIPAPFVEASSNDRRGVATDLTVSKGIEPNPDARDEIKKRVGNFRQAIVKAFEAANSPNLPETSRAELWLSQGYQEDICLAVIAGIVAKNPSVTTLNYFDKPIATAHAAKAPPRTAVALQPEQVDWDATLATYKKTGHWSRWAGPDPEQPGCKAPKEMLAKYGLVKSREATAVIPQLRAMQ